MLRCYISASREIVSISGEQLTKGAVKIYYYYYVLILLRIASDLRYFSSSKELLVIKVAMGSEKAI